MTESLSGPLRIHSKNPRYFADGSGNVIYLTGSHTWSNIQEHASSSPFDYRAYLDWLQKYNHNFTRLWTWESGLLGEWIHGYNENTLLAQPTIYRCVGKRETANGMVLPIFDLSKYNEDFFDRLLERATLAKDRGIYVSIMLFQGWELDAKGRKSDSWDGHPYNKLNNVNGVNGDPEGYGNGFMIQTLEIPATTRLQEAYVKKVVDTVNELDNVLYEISNESDGSSTEWQYHMINYVHEYEKNKPKQHPVGMTFQYSRVKKGTNANLFRSPADWVSPNPQAEAGYDYCYNPPPANGKKVVLLDTDHLWGIGGDSVWVWKSFLRGYNPIFMDPYDTGFMDPCDSGLIDVGNIDPDWESARIAMGQTRMLAERIGLADMTPHPELAHTRYCLANIGVEYLVYRSPEMSTRIQADLTAVRGEFSVEWFNPETGIFLKAESVEGGDKIVFRAPFKRSAVLYLKSYSIDRWKGEHVEYKSK